jgi:carboxyl-terminal processing protease
MKNKNILLWIGLGLLALIIICVVIFGTIGAVGYFFFADSFDFENWSFNPNEIINTPVPVISTEVPLGSNADLEKLFSPMWEAIELLHAHSVYQPIDNEALADGALEGLLLYFEELEIAVDEIVVPENFISPSEFSHEAKTPDHLFDYYLPFWETWQKIDFAGLDEDVSYDDFFHSSMYLMVDAVGDYMTGFMEPIAYEHSQISLEGEYEGIGAWVDTSTGVVTIVTPMDGSPAEAAGLKPGDRIIAVDGQSLEGMEGNEMLALVLGPAGTVVVLTVEREEVPEPFDVSVTRAAITVPSIVSEMLEEQIAYIQLTKFGGDTGEDLRDALELLLADDPIGIILDLRNNGGGYLYTAVEVVSEFIEDGVVLHERYSEEDEDVYYVIPEGLAIDIPLVILVNEGSASASEIVAGAIQDYDRGELVGATTFGKGSVQLVFELSNNRGAIRITNAKWLTPEERQIQDIGLEPDYAVEYTQEDYDAGLDPQLDKAIELLLD